MFTPAEYRLMLVNAAVMPLAVDLAIATIWAPPDWNTATIVVIPLVVTDTITAIPEVIAA